MFRITPLGHGLLEYLVIPVWATAPRALDLTGAPGWLAYGIAGLIATLALLTDYPLGILRVVPFTVHGLIDRVGAPLIVLAPWIVGFADQLPARWFFVAGGGFALLVTLLTDFGAQGVQHSREVRGSRHGFR